MRLTLRLPDWDPQSERLIAFLRLALAAGALMVIFIDPTQPSRHWQVAYAAFVLYLLYSAVVFQMVRTRPRPWLPISTQIIDLLWVPPAVHFTEGANTPFFPFFVIFTLNAGIRWGMWGAWAVTAYSLIVYGSLLFVEPPTPLNLNNDLMRLGYFLIVGVLGGYLAEYRLRREAELKALQSISEAIGSKHGAVSAVATMVEMARQAALADSVVAVLREPGEGDLVMVRGAADITNLGADEAAPFLAAAGAPPTGRGTRAVQLTQVDAVILRFAEADKGLAYPIRAGAELVGAIFFFAHGVARPWSRRRASDEFLGLLLRHIIPQLETLYVLEQARHAQVLEERRRIARDLHDSFIQVLAALGLRLDVLCATSGDPATDPLRKELAQIREIIGRELRRVRAYLAEMREPLTEIGSLRELVEKTGEAFRARTQLAVAVNVNPSVVDVPAEVVRELAPLLREALTNVEKHARASRVAISANLDDQHLTLVVEDDGVGLAPSGRAAPDLGSGYGQGLFSMRERARLLGGSLTFDRPEAGGTVLAVTIPLHALV
jgi:signal transduction histidine kinase